MNFRSFVVGCGLWVGGKRGGEEKSHGLVIVSELVVYEKKLYVFYFF